MAATTRIDMKELCGTNQQCSGLKAGIEGALHAMKGLFDESSGTDWDLLVADGSSALTSVSRMARNISVLQPRCSCYLCNCY